MVPSIDELKVAASSRVESILSQSSSTVLQPSASAINLNLPSEPLRNRINLLSSNQVVDSRTVSTSAMTGAGPATISAQENLRTTAQTINGFIQKDKIQPDLGELLNGNLHILNIFSKNYLGQFSREYIYGEEHRPILQFMKHSLIPEILLNQIRQDSSNCFMGLFPEIRRAWLTSGNALYLWSFENNRDFTHYLKSQYEIIDVALVRPKAAIFSESVEWLIVVVTPMEILLLATTFDSPDKTGSGFIGEHVKELKNYANLDLSLHETGFNFPSDEVNMVSICATKNGRIFLAGSDGNIYELNYQQETDWFSPKCKKVNKTASALSYIVPTFLRTSPSRACVVKLHYDASRNIIYGLTEQSTIHVYWLGSNCQDFEFIGVTGDLSSEAMKLTPAGIISSSKALDIVSIHPVDFSESDIISLVAVCRSGVRLYFSIIGPTQANANNFPQTSSYPTQMNQQRYSQAPRGIRLVHLRAPPEENRVRDPKKLVHRWSPNIHCALYSNGVTLAANTISNEEDALLGMIMNPSVGSYSASYRLPLEYSIEAAIDGKVWAIEELSFGDTQADSEFKGLGKEFALAHLSPRRFFAILTNVGVYIYSKLRPVDQLYLLLSEANLPMDQLEKFFDAYGREQACAFCISLCCRSSSESRWNAPLSNGSEIALTFNNNVISVLLKFGGNLNLIDPRNDRNILFSRNQTDNARDGIGRIIATQPEFENSPLHEGFYIFFSRLVSSIWKKSLWDFKAVAGNVIFDLSKFYRFISDNLAIFTESRRLSNPNGTNEELLQRRQNALEFENESLTRLKETAGLLIELLTFIAICVDYALLEALRSEPIGIQNSGMNIEFLLTSSKGKSLINELGNILVQKQLRLRSPIKPLCDSLRSRCSSFFSEEDVFLQEGLEALERASLCRSLNERTENIVEALAALKKASRVIPISNLHSIFKQIDHIGFPDISILLGLHFIEVMDPDNLGLKRENNPNIQLGSDEHEICRQRESIYSRLIESIASTGFDSDKTKLLVSANPSMDLLVLRTKCLNLVASSRDELFHYRVYEWLVRSQYSQTLFGMLHSEFLYKYLKSTFLSREDSHRDLLWKWLARTCKYSEAAAVLASIAESREYPLSLSQRIEYISLAMTHCKSAALQSSQEHLSWAGVDEIAPIELSYLEELLEVSHTQYEVLKEAKAILGTRNEVICAELDGLVGLLTVSDLFNRYARPYGLIESCLRLIHISGLVNERLVSQLWQEIISKYVGENSDRSAFHQLGSKITELSRKFYPSPNAFPLAHLIDVLGRLALSSDIGADWLVAVLINSGIPLTALSDEFHRFFSDPPSKSWLSVSFRAYLLEMIVIFFNIWTKDYTRVSANNPMVVSRLKAYYAAAEEIQSNDLINELGTLLKQLASQ
jgi:nuclear pore complex protein Nup155